MFQPHQDHQDAKCQRCHRTRPWQWVSHLVRNSRISPNLRGGLQGLHLVDLCSKRGFLKPLRTQVYIFYMLLYRLLTFVHFIWSKCWMGSLNPCSGQLGTLSDRGRAGEPGPEHDVFLVHHLGTPSFPPTHLWIDPRLVTVAYPTQLAAFQRELQLPRGTD
jgi:hypothetical protein